MNKYLLIIIILMFIWAFFIEPNLITIKRYKLPEIFNHQKIVFISDLHTKKWNKSRLQRIVKLINEQNPDLVLSAGDYIQGHTGNISMPIEEQAQELSKIKAPFVTVLGNHDCWFDKYSVKNALEDVGLKVLINSNIKINNIYVAGVDDLQTGLPDINTALAETESPRILLSHTPDIYYDVKDDVDLILAGHVHGGQVRLPFYGALLVPSKYGNKFACGEFNETKNRMIVTKGLGTSILGVRFNAVPEIVILE